MKKCIIATALDEEWIIGTALAEEVHCCDESGIILAALYRDVHNYDGFG